MLANINNRLKTLSCCELPLALLPLLGRILEEISSLNALYGRGDVVQVSFLDMDHGVVVCQKQHGREQVNVHLTWGQDCVLVLLRDHQRTIKLTPAQMKVV